ncbi:MAG: DUF2809 domain-containing protein [Candidatus Latescibacteria bacterium]|nr:DUF2809 domain-containing protein [Candidatus Latescibacterota bacterium]
MSPQHLKTGIALLTLIPVGLYTKSYGGPGSIWVQNYLGGTLYEIFWCLAASLCLPRANPRHIAAGIFLITSILEGLQLYHPPILEIPRQTLLGHALLGSAFDLWDFPHYLLGCILGWTGITIFRQGNHSQ